MTPRQRKPTKQDSLPFPLLVRHTHLNTLPLMGKRVVETLLKLFDIIDMRCNIALFEELLNKNVMLLSLTNSW